MKQLGINLWRWLTGWGRFDEVSFQPGWRGNQPRWILLYGLNYGTRVLFGGACVSWSRWCYDNRDKHGLAAFVDRLLQRFDRDHGQEAGPPLWDTKDTAGAAVGAVIAFCLTCTTAGVAVGWLISLVLVVV